MALADKMRPFQPGVGMRRRDFIKAIGGATWALATWPLTARAQQGMPVIGLLSARSPDESASLVAAFRRGLAENGAVEGQNVAIEYRWALGDYSRLPAMAAELVHRPVSVLATVGGEAAARAAIAATKAIPIVAIFADDPVASGLVASVSRPGGNATGAYNFNPGLEAKRLGLLHELVPQAATIGVLLNPKYPPSAGQLEGAEEAALRIGLKTVILRASTDSEIESAFDAAARHPIDMLTVTSDPFFNTRSERIVALAARHAIPAVYPFREYFAAGGLMSYGVDLREMYRQIGIYAGQILKGVKPADLPIMQPIKFDLLLNLKTAKTLGIKVSDKLMSLADDVIE